jgi:hypothetical protein
MKLRQPHAPASLSQEEDRSALIEWEARWDPEVAWTVWRRENKCALMSKFCVQQGWAIILVRGPNR